MVWYMQVTSKVDDQIQVAFARARLVYSALMETLRDDETISRYVGQLLKEEQVLKLQDCGYGTRCVICKKTTDCLNDTSCAGAMASDARHSIGE
jgi:hypothetical protein